MGSKNIRRQVAKFAAIKCLLHKLISVMHKNSSSENNFRRHILRKNIFYYFRTETSYCLVLKKIKNKNIVQN